MGGWRAWPSPRGGVGDGGGGGNRHRNSWKPPPHLQSTGAVHSSIPLWEKKFCSNVCMIPWRLLRENQKYIGVYKNVLEWDDSAALEAFQNAKRRFWAHYHGVSCDIPLPDPEMYIDEVEPYGFVDPDLVADLERWISLPKYENVVSNNRCLLLSETVAATGWDDAENTVTDNTGSKCQLLNWDAYIEQPTQATTWGGGTVPSSSCWDAKNCFGDAWNAGGSGWDAVVRQDDSWGSRRMNYDGTSNQAGAMQDDSWNSRSKYSHNNSGSWGPGATWDDSWCNNRNNTVKHGNNHDHGCNEATIQNDSYRVQRINHLGNDRSINVPWKDRNCESGRTYGRKRYGGCSSSRANKMRYQNRVH